MAGGQDVVLDAAGQDRIRRLLAAEALTAATLGGPLCLDDLGRSERRLPEVTDLALVDEVTEGAERLVDVGVVPNIIAPRQSFETETPVRPSMRCNVPPASFAAMRVWDRCRLILLTVDY
jgi:hypothetical protein